MLMFVLAVGMWFLSGEVWSLKYCKASYSVCESDSQYESVWRKTCDLPAQLRPWFSMNV